MNFTNTSDDTLLKIWKNLKGGLNEVNKTIQNGTFHKVGTKGAAPPSQAGQTTLWFAMAVDNELTRRGVKH